MEFWRGLFEQAAAAASGVLWEVWADTRGDAARLELRVGNFEAPPETPVAAASTTRIPVWRMV